MTPMFDTSKSRRFLRTPKRGQKGPKSAICGRINISTPNSRVENYIEKVRRKTVFTSALLVSARFQELVPFAGGSRNE